MAGSAALLPQPTSVPTSLTKTNMANRKAKRWCFTINNYTDEHINALTALPSVYCIWGKETAPTTGTLHLQGFVVFENARHRTAVVADIGGGHWVPANGTSLQASEYCKKDGSFTERGILPVNQGKRKDLERIVDWLDEFITDNGRAPTDREIAAEQPVAVLRKIDISRLARLRAPHPVIRAGVPRDWQAALQEELSQDADDRSVIFYVDSLGGKGKTWFQQWLVTEHPTTVQILGVGKRDDMCFAIDPDKSIFLVNVPRGGMEFLQYTVLEQLKDRMVFSTKYMSVMKVLPKNVHVIVFTNEDPDLTKMSEDRYDVRPMA